MTTQTAAELEESLVPVTVIPTQKKKSRTKSVCIVRDKEEVELLQNEEEAGPEIITQFLSLGELSEKIAATSHESPG